MAETMEHIKTIVPMVVAWCMLFSSSTFAGSRNYGERLAKLRAEVDDLESDIDQMRSSFRTRRTALENQEGDLEVILRKEQVRQETLRRLRAKQIAQRRRAESWSTRLMKPAKKAARMVRRLILDTLPFKKHDRLAAVDEISKDLKGPRADPAMAISRLWQMLEDELKLTAEVGLHRQVIDLHGKKTLVQVARIGMGVMYFRTESGKFGWAAKAENGRYSFKLFSDEESIKSVESLFIALRKQIRKGYFNLPLPCPANTGGQHED
ncbi:MAG: DUF3450 domain-containing protein [Deltaproteobacteria bacterium]|nr:DUF3450 domain-containing protein [Deltaproteobacteria bacterium]